ncbi:hypothetical protein jhhlp_005596 [Lomentospora prolificans]|uniref:Guanine nucleotide exchange factor LTE1 n=1 Tax=Lomentospora prolificans TaxID=41688 RepID=A0A2N3N3K3_9PEZI|nr:hypothetical protein jhhlp_005596 [Lomentospora prolificans]
MDAIQPLASNPPTAADLNARIPQRDPTSRINPLSPRGLTQDARFAKNMALAASGREPVARTGRIVRQPSGSAKPLVPVTERKSQEENVYTWRIRKEPEGEKVDIAPDGNSAGREGRQFTVANVGHNGRIYLRPTIRPAHQRPPQPHFVFPITPPSTAGLDALVTEKKQKDGPNVESFGNAWESTPAPSLDTELGPMSSIQPQTRRRAVSDSTIREATTTSAVREMDDGAFKVVISKPTDDPRPKTTEDIETIGPPVLDINIPSWRIGSPRFSVKGTPAIRGSSCAPTEEFGSSHASFLNSRLPEPTTTIPSRFSSRRPSRLNVMISAIPQLPRNSTPRILSPTSPQIQIPFRSTYLSTHLVIEPGMFDGLTFKPACDDRTIVRYSSTGTVTAATPPRLVAEITSPTFLDYELISDFFLTFRAFLEPSDLVRMLFARLRWAILRADEIGMVVRVRTFVALRHWILNYFMDDFVVEYSLRVTFCNLLNDLVDDILQDCENSRIHLKILSELKKCWRRVCAQFWDGFDYDSSVNGSLPIAPGGIAGHRDPNLDPSHWESADPVQLDLAMMQIPDFEPSEASTPRGISAGTPHDGSVVERPGTPENLYDIHDLRRQQAGSPISITSLDIVSCSFPAKSIRNLPSSHMTPAAHPVPGNHAISNTGLVAITPKSLVGKRVRQGHKRNGSITDSLREHSVDKLSFKDTAEASLTMPYAGSLVRGDLLPPGQAFVDIASPTSIGDSQRETTFLQLSPDSDQKEKSGASAMSGQGMRRLIGSVRRALSTRGQGMPATHGNFINISPIGPRGATTNRLPGTAIVPQARPRQNGARPPVRIDLLGAEIAEDFKKAVREDAAAEAAAQRALTTPMLNSSLQPEADKKVEYSTAHLDSSFDDLPKLSNFRPQSEMAITTGSKSIVIVDDTAFDMPTMHGALPIMNPSLEAFADTFAANGGDPTPPTTPPGRPIGTPRRSSFLLNQHLTRASLSSDPLPPFIPDMATLGCGQSSAGRHSHVTSYPSMIEQSIQVGMYPSSTPRLRSTKFHSRQRSSKTIGSVSSILHRRHNSFHSSTARPLTVRSFDATTQSEGSIMDSSEVMPQPLRVLRRRPGGNLGAVATVGELAAPLRRSRSVGSLTAYSESLHSSYVQRHESGGFVDIISVDFSQHSQNNEAFSQNNETFSLGAIAEQRPNRQLSLFSTHSSKPIMRPSFEAEARKLAQIPDDADDDGGVESALLKLEGKYEKKPKPPASPQPNPEEIGKALGDPDLAQEEKRERRHLEILGGDDGLLNHRLSGIPEPSSDVHNSFLVAPGRPVTEPRSFLSSEPSYCSIPLLDRGLLDEGQARPSTSTQEWADISILRGAEDESPYESEREDDTTAEPRQGSFDVIEETDSLKRVKAAEISRPAGPVENDDRDEGDTSFLDDASDAGASDISSELSEAPEIDSYALGSTGLASPRQGFIFTKGMLSPPAEQPKTLAETLLLSPEATNVPQLHEHQVWEQKPLPPTPETTPTTIYRSRSPSDPTGTTEALRGAPKMQDPELSRKYSVHLPFILAFDSEILAQQFTLIEKDALNEIDWKELIDMEWKNATNNDSRSWVDFLRNTDARGVEVVIARFNIMVKWAISEIVLTQDIEERARCIIKFIHIASHSRRYRNFATMAQVVIALSSQEVTRLSRTWALVPPHDLKTFHDLEQLVSPTRNFYSLRAEMEGGASSGCIPFVGIYTHDLLFNAQRPSEIASSPTTAPLVNFERCRCAASVVKTLLRLLEESTLYEFQPIEGITERCLWMSALTDEQIRRHSESLE